MMLHCIVVLRVGCQLPEHPDSSGHAAAVAVPHAAETLGCCSVSPAAAPCQLAECALALTLQCCWPSAPVMTTTAITINTM